MISRSYPLLIQARVALPAVGVERTPRLDAILDEGMQAGGGGVFNHPHPNPPNARAIGLGGYDDQSFTFGLPACDALFQSTPCLHAFQAFWMEPIEWSRLMTP